MGAIERSVVLPGFAQLGRRGWRAEAASRVDPIVTLAASLAVVLAVATAVLVAVPWLGLVTIDPRLDLVVNTLAAVVAAIVAAAAWLRYLGSHRGSGALEAAAFLILTLAGGLHVAATLVGSPSAATGVVEGSTAIYAGLAARLTVGILLLGAALARWTEWVPSRRLAGAMLIVPPAAFLALLAALSLLGPALPPLLAGDTLQAVPLVHLLGLAAGVILGVAAAIYLRHHRVSREQASAFLGLGLILLAFGQAHYGFFPGAQPGIVASEDVLRVAFAVVLLVGHAAQQRGDLLALQTANVALARYRDSDVQRARMEERARLARDLHDGLAQKLWRARLVQGRLGDALTGTHGEAAERTRQLSHETEAALVAAIAEARRALDAMRQAGGEASLSGVLETELAEFTRQTGVRVALGGDGRFAELPIGLRPELLGILREALSNIERHADATMVRVGLERENGRLTMRISDNGRGFDPGRPRENRYGLLGMRERAAILHANVEVRSAPQAGTVVEVVVPVTAGRAR